MTFEEKDRTRTLWLCGVLHAFTHVYTVALLPLYLLIQKDLGLRGEGQVTFLMTALGFTYCLGSYPMGVLADRWNRKVLLGVGLAVNGLAFVGLSLAPTYGWAVACCVTVGLAGSFYHPAATAMLADLFPTGTGKALGRVGMGAAIGFWLSPTYTGWRAATAGCRAPVLELGVLGIVGAAVFVWLAPRGHAVHPHTERARHLKPRISSVGFWSLILAASLFFSLRDFAGAGMGTLSSLFLQQAWGFDPKTTGQMLGGMFLAAMISNPLFGSWSDRTRLRLTGAVLGIAAGMVAFMPWAPRAWGIVVLVVYGFFFLASYPIIEATLMESVPVKVRGRVFGLFVAVSGTIASLSHWVVGDRVHALTTHAASAFAPIFGMLALLILTSMGGLPILNVVRKYARTHPVEE